MSNETESSGILCRCHSNQLYRGCCLPLHQGELAPSPIHLMRSRYSAYSLGMVDYIIRTTHPDEPAYNADLHTWRREIADFCQTNHFVGLQILRAEETGDLGFVEFVALLEQGGRVLRHAERSQFQRTNGRWLYARAHQLP